MARRHNDVLGVGGAETIIGSGVKLKGNLHSEGDIIVDAHMSGDIKTIGSVTIGNNGQVKANVTAGDVVVAGSLIGNITASGEVEIREAGQVHGNITAASLSIMPGGVFVGTSRQTTGITHPEET